MLGCGWGWGADRCPGRGKEGAAEVMTPGRGLRQEGCPAMGI